MMKRERLQQGEYKMAKLEELEQRQDAIEARFDELHAYLGHQYCSGLEPSSVGFKRCASHLVLEQIRTYLIVGIILFINDRLCQLISIFIAWNVFYVIQLTWVQAESRQSRVTGWIKFAFCVVVNYYQLIALAEVD